MVAIAMHDAAFDGDAHAVAAWLDEGGGVDTTYGRLCLCTQLMVS